MFFVRNDKNKMYADDQKQVRVFVRVVVWICQLLQEMDGWVPHGSQNIDSENQH